ncbi:MAG: D-aminoacyl-tRNA deacylase [Planctomycetota bacterium]
MRIVLQRCLDASVAVDDQIVGEIKHGLVALIGVGQGDNENVADTMAAKVHQLRIFNDDHNKMNQSVMDIGGDVLAISQFTLLADCKKGRRPAFTAAADPVKAKQLYERVVDQLRLTGMSVPTGIFAADMKVRLTNDGPVTIVLDSSELTGNQNRSSG